jgi:plastocyanin
MKLGALIVALLSLTFLLPVDCIPAPSHPERATTDVSGEVQVIETGSARTHDLSQVVVWLVPTGAVQQISTTTQKTHYRLVQHNKRFEPKLLVVPVGSIVDFPNADPWFHNVFSLYRGKRFDLGLYQAGTQKSVKFDRIGASYLFCNIHPGMTGVVLAIDSNFFGASDKEGHYSVPDVPAGSYTMHVWYENATPEALKGLQKTLVIEGENRVLPVILVPAVRQIQRNHKNKYGQDYDPDTLKTDY